MATTYGDGAYAIRLNNATMTSGPYSGNFTSPTSNPTVTQLTQTITNNGSTLSGYTATFQDAVDPSTFATADVTVTYDGPNGTSTPIPITVTSVTDISGNGLHNVYAIGFAGQTNYGYYTITIGPNIYDFAGDPMTSAYTNKNYFSDTAPTISTIPTQTIVQGNTDGPVSFTIGSPLYSASQLSVSDSYTAIGVTTGGLTLTLGGSGANQTITIATTAGTYGIFNVTLTVTDPGGLTGTMSFNVDVDAAMSITPTSLPDGDVGTGYSQTVGVTGGTGPFSFSLQTGDILPSGLNPINPSTGVITGTPTTVGSYTFTVVATDAFGQTATQQYTIVINSQMSITGPASLENWAFNEPGYNQTVTATGGTPGYTWTLTGAPSGLSIDNTGAITGTPGAAGTFTFVVTATDTVGGTATKSYSVNFVNGIVIENTSLPNWDVNYSTYSQTLTAIESNGFGQLDLVGSVGQPAPRP